MRITTRIIPIFLIVLVFIVLSCKSTKKKEEYANNDQVKSLNSGILTFISIKDTIRNKSYEQAFESEFKAYITESDQLSDFDISHQEILEKKDINLANITSHAEVFYANSSPLENGCYRSVFVDVPNAYHPQTHLFILNNDSDYEQFFARVGYVFFEGELCIQERKITSISNRGDDSKANFAELFEYFDSIGLQQKELNRPPNQLKLTAVKLDFDFKGQKYTAREEALTAKSKQIIIDFPDGVKKHIIVPKDENLPRWLEKKSTKEYLEGLNEGTIYPDSVRKKALRGEENNPFGRTQEVSPLERAKEIYSSYTDNFGILKSKFRADPGKKIKAGSTNIVKFGRLEGYNGEYAYREVKDTNKFEQEDFDRFEYVRRIVEVVKEANFIPGIGGKNGRTMVSQPQTMSSDGLSYIKQKLHPLSQTHLELGQFNPNVLRTQFKSLAEVIQFLHAPKKINGMWYMIVHRDLNVKNLYQQSKVDLRVAIDDFDKSEMIFAPTPKELEKKAKRVEKYALAGTPSTVDINIIKKDHFSFNELKQSDIWSLGVIMLQHTFGQGAFRKIIGNPYNLDRIISIFGSGQLPKKVESYFGKSADKILKENPELTIKQIQGMKEFIKSSEYKLIKSSMLRVDPNSRLGIDKIVEQLSSST